MFLQCGINHILTYLFIICIFQKHTITTIPITQCDCNQKGGKKMTYYVYGLDNKVHAPTYPDTFCWGCEIMWRNTLNSLDQYHNTNYSVHFFMSFLLLSKCHNYLYMYLLLLIIAILILIINHLEGDMICLICWSTRRSVMWKVILVFVIRWRSLSVHLYVHYSFYNFFPIWA